MPDLLGEHERAVVVPALAPVLLGLVEAEEAQLAHAREDGVRERGLLPLLRVRRELFDGEVADRLAQLFVLVGEQEVFALGVEVGLLHALGGGGHVGGLLVVLGAGFVRLCPEKLALWPGKGKRGRWRASVPSQGVRSLNTMSYTRYSTALESPNADGDSRSAPGGDR